MKKLMKCSYCDSDVVFIELPPEHPHNWKAVCSSCKSKKGGPRFKQWVSNETIINIIDYYPGAKILHREEENCKPTVETAQSIWEAIKAKRFWGKNL
jgi:hypothetical protein